MTTKKRPTLPAQTFFGGMNDQLKITKDSVSKQVIKVLAAQKKPLTRRQLSLFTGIEICTLCQPLWAMVQSGRIVVSYIGICPTTGQSVYHYSLEEKKP